MSARSIAAKKKPVPVKMTEPVTHLHWEFVAFNEGDQIPDTNTVRWMVIIEVKGWANEEDARSAAEIALRRDCYKLRRVWECTSCDINKKNAEAFQVIAEATRG